MGERGCRITEFCWEGKLVPLYRQGGGWAEVLNEGRKELPMSTSPPVAGEEGAPVRGGLKRKVGRGLPGCLACTWTKPALHLHLLQLGPQVNLSLPLRNTSWPAETQRLIHVLKYPNRSSPGAPKPAGLVRPREPTQRPPANTTGMPGPIAVETHGKLQAPSSFENP